MKVPQHVVLFPDGNGRWVKQNKLPLLAGYKKGYENLVDFCYWCKNREVKVLTVFGFTTKNWSRPQKFLNLLFKLLEKKLVINIEKYLKSDELQKLGVRVRIIGQKERLPKSLQKLIGTVEEATKNNSNLFLNLAIGYGGRWDILQAVKKIVQDKIPAEKIDEKLFESYLSTFGLPDPDFIIRTGGDMRLSNFALWQSASTELYFTQKLWPDFTEQDLDIAFAEFNKRSR